MKKTLAILTALVMVFAATAALADEPAFPTFSYGVQFNMDMDQVMKLVPITRYEIDNEKTRGSVEFAELEYENVTDGEAVPFDEAKIGNGKYAVDDDGDLKDCKEMIVDNGLTIVLEQDRDGDVDITLLDTTAAYINN